MWEKWHKSDLKQLVCGGGQAILFVQWNHLLRSIAYFQTENYPEHSFAVYLHWFREEQSMKVTIVKRTNVFPYFFVCFCLKIEPCDEMNGIYGHIDIAWLLLLMIELYDFRFDKN